MFPDICLIKEKRKKNGINQKQLSEISKVSQSTIAKIETGKIKPSYDVVKNIFLSLEKLENKNIKRCKDIMTKKVICINFNKKILEASKLMKKYSISQIPVLNDNKIIGTITESNIISKISNLNYDYLMNLSVSKIMSSPLPILNLENTIISIIPIVKEVGAVIIMDNNKIVGIISKSDLL
jgi:predicted transcriptional regulator